MTVMANFRMTVRMALVLLAALTFGLPCGMAAEGDKPGPKAAATTRPAKAPAGGDASAGVDFEQFVLNRSPVPVTRSRGAGPKSPGVAEALPADGSALSGRTCRLGAPNSQGWRSVVLDPVAGKGGPHARRVLPCRLLEQMEAVVSKRPGARFRIWGENATYEDCPYVLPLAVIVVPPPRPPAPKPEVTPPDDKPAPDKPDAPAGIDDVIRDLLKDKPGRAIVLPASRNEAVKDSDGVVAPGVNSPAARARGDIVVDRLVRMIPAAPGRQWSVVRFEADNALTEPPMRLLPCQKRARAETLEVDGLLCVTGRVTFYNGRRYLLLRKVLLQRRLGRF